MSTILVSERIEEVSPRTKARVAGGFYLSTILNKSTFLPRIPGVLSAVGMAGDIVRFAVVAGFSTALWLLVFGVNEQRWREQARAAGQ